MVARVLELEPGKRIKALKKVTGNEIYFLGHFRDFSIMPGTSIIEAIGQSASILRERRRTRIREPQPTRGSAEAAPT
jgi:3-hydroxymyristoyl/3-hydroxydecanoyl-(acyl carrier protein) dehydratase